MGNKKEASETLSEFLDFLDTCERQYQTARDAVGLEDRRLQDLLHELEFAQDKAERNRVATKFQRSRRERRKQKEGQRYEGGDTPTPQGHRDPPPEPTTPRSGDDDDERREPPTQRRKVLGGPLQCR